MHPNQMYGDKTVKLEEKKEKDPLPPFRKYEAKQDQDTEVTQPPFWNSPGTREER